MVFQVFRVAAVIALLCAAAALAAPPGRVPLPFRGLMKVLGAKSAPESGAVSLPRRIAAAVSVLAAVALALLSGSV